MKVFDTGVILSKLPKLVGSDPVDTGVDAVSSSRLLRVAVAGSAEAEAPSMEADVFMFATVEAVPSFPAE